MGELPPSSESDRLFEQRLFAERQMPTLVHGWEYIQDRQMRAIGKAERGIKMRERSGSQRAGLSLEEMRKQALSGQLYTLAYEVGLAETYGADIPPRWLNTKGEWTYREKCFTDMKRAWVENHTLSAPLVDAALNMASSHILEMTAQGQKLDQKQLAWALYSPWLKNPDKRQEVLGEVREHQKQLGVSDDELVQAQAVAEELMEAERTGRITDEIKTKALNPFQLELNSLIHISPDPDDVVNAMGELVPQRVVLTPQQRDEQMWENMRKKHDLLAWELDGRADRRVPEWRPPKIDYKKNR